MRSWFHILHNMVVVVNACVVFGMTPCEPNLHVDTRLVHFLSARHNLRLATSSRGASAGSAWISASSLAPGPECQSVARRCSIASSATAGICMVTPSHVFGKVAQSASGFGVAYPLGLIT